MAGKTKLNIIDISVVDSNALRIQSSSSSHVPNGEITDSTQNKKVRGPTMLQDVWTLPSEKRIVVHVNDLNQPIGLEGRKLSAFLGTLVRNADITPLIYHDWRIFPVEMKTHLLMLVKNRFDFSPKAEVWILRALGKAFKDYRCDLKARHFERHKSKEELLKTRPDGIPDLQWSFLVNLWYSDKNMRSSMINKNSREKQKLPHTAGSKSFARIASERMNAGLDHSRARIFLETHKSRKDGRPLDEESSRVVELMKEKLAQTPYEAQGQTNFANDIYSQVIGLDSYGRVRGLGLGVTPKSFKINSSLQDEAMIDENNKLKDIVNKLGDEQRKMQAENTKMQSQLNMLTSLLVERRIVDAFSTLNENNPSYGNLTNER